VYCFTLGLFPRPRPIIASNAPRGIVLFSIFFFRAHRFCPTYLATACPSITVVSDRRQASLCLVFLVPAGLSTQPTRHHFRPACPPSCPCLPYLPPHLPTRPSPLSPLPPSSVNGSSDLFLFLVLFLIRPGVRTGAFSALQNLRVPSPPRSHMHPLTLSLPRPT
jgi:hypothetical protein